jgi:hypothetical protein
MLQWIIISNHCASPAQNIAITRIMVWLLQELMTEEAVTSEFGKTAQIE